MGSYNKRVFYFTLENKKNYLKILCVLHSFWIPLRKAVLQTTLKYIFFICRIYWLFLYWYRKADYKTVFFCESMLIRVSVYATICPLKKWLFLWYVNKFVLPSKKTKKLRSKRFNYNLGYFRFTENALLWGCFVAKLIIEGNLC